MLSLQWLRKGIIRFRLSKKTGDNQFCWFWSASVSNSEIKVENFPCETFLTVGLLTVYLVNKIHFQMVLYFDVFDFENFQFGSQKLPQTPLPLLLTVLYLLRKFPFIILQFNSMQRNTDGPKISESGISFEIPRCSNAYIFSSTVFIFASSFEWKLFLSIESLLLFIFENFDFFPALEPEN